MPRDSSWSTRAPDRPPPDRPGGAAVPGRRGRAEPAGEHWPAPTPDHPVDGEVRLPGSKSLTNRALVLAALADGPSVIRGPLRGRDTLLMAAALGALRPGIDTTATDWTVEAGELAAGGSPAVDVGNAGTVLRFVPPVAALVAAAVRFDGDPRARQRPVAPLLTALRELGVDVDDGGRGRLPFTIRGTGAVAGGPVVLDASASSQLVSGLLLAGSRYEKGIEVRHQGPPVPSAHHLAMTLEVLRAAGVDARATGPAAWRVSPGRPRGREVTIEPDLSNAAPFLAAALVTGGRVRIPGWPARTTQPGSALPGLLTRMGAVCELGPDGLTVRGGGRVRGLDADLIEVGELTPVLAALAALADSPSRLRGIGHLRRHETDRLAALAREIGRLGGAVRELPDALEITPRPLRAGDTPFLTYDDHRMVMAGAVLGLAVPGLHVADPATVGKTLPEFTRLWADLVGG